MNRIKLKNGLCATTKQSLGLFQRMLNPTRMTLIFPENKFTSQTFGLTVRRMANRLGCLGGVLDGHTLLWNFSLDIEQLTVLKEEGSFLGVPGLDIDWFPPAEPR